MNILIAPNAFKESLTAMEAAEAISAGVRVIFPRARLTLVPIADGGDGTLETVVAGTRGRILKTNVLNPLGTRITAEFGITGDGKTAIIEMSRASGLALVPPGKRDPLVTTSYGTGELIRAALQRNVRSIILGIGGSATVDGGIGALQALGVDFMDRRGKSVGWGGNGLLDTCQIRLEGADPRLKHTRLMVACDVENPLVGRRGAAAVFGPQKGATPRTVRQLDKGLSRLARLIAGVTGAEVAGMPGSGAAGGIAGSLHGLLGAQLKPGSELVFDLLHLRKIIPKMDLVITGEGRLDFQTRFGKAPGVLAKIAREFNVPVVGLAGSLGQDLKSLYDYGFSSLFSITDSPMTLETAMENAESLLQSAAHQVARTLKLAESLGSKRGSKRKGRPQLI
jgi:glycerate 2-kinase